LGLLGLFRGNLRDAAIGGVAGAVIGPEAIIGIIHFVIQLLGGRRALGLRHGGSMNAPEMNLFLSNIFKDQVPNDKLELANKITMYLVSKITKYKLDIREDDLEIIKESIQVIENIDIKTSIQLLLYLGITKGDIKNTISMAGDTSNLNNIKRVLNNNSTRKNNNATKKNKTRTKN
jgi:hypothetical protein